MPGDGENMSDEAIWETLPVRILFLKIIFKNYSYQTSFFVFLKTENSFKK